jgi:hypothetical protein
LYVSDAENKLMAKQIGNKYFNAKGLDGMQGITQALAMMEATEAGADWDGGTRTDPNGNSNQDIIEYLAAGGRDITPNEKDGNKAVELYANQVTKHLNLIGKTGVNTPELTKKKILSGITAGLRDAAKFIASVMYKRVKSGVDNEGNRKPVTKAYAKQRNRKHGIADNRNIIFTATLQLANALQTKNIKVRINKSGLGRAMKIFNKG